MVTDLTHSSSLSRGVLIVPWFDIQNNVRFSDDFAFLLFFSRLSSIVRRNTLRLDSFSFFVIRPEEVDIIIFFFSLGGSSSKRAEFTFVRRQVLPPTESVDEFGIR